MRNNAGLNENGSKSPPVIESPSDSFQVVEAIHHSDKRTSASTVIHVVRSLKTGKCFVEKRISISSKIKKEKALREIQTLEQLRNAGPSPHINFLHKALINGVPGHASLILEYCEGGNIQSMMNTDGTEDAIIAEGFVWHVVASVTKALCFLHEGIDVYKHDATPIEAWNPICHLDIKPENVYLTNKHRNADYPRVVLGDLGCAVTRDDVVSGRVNREYPHQFTPSIVPPENRLEGDISRWKGKYGLVTDMWQLGGLMQVMCTRSHQPSLSKAKTMYACGPQYGFKANEVAWRLMHTDCTRRPRATELMEELKILLPPMGVIL